jgi:hypothetical protein
MFPNWSLKIPEGEGRGVVEGLAGGLPERLVLVDDLRLVEGYLQVQDGLFGRLQDRVEAPQDRHRQDDVAVLAPDVQIAEHIVRDPPDEIGDPGQRRLVHL